MDILFIAPYAPGHVRVRSFHLLQHLLRRGHAVTLMMPGWSGDGQSRVAALETAGARVVRVPVSHTRSWANCLAALLRRRPMQAWHAWSPALARRLREELAGGRVDVLHVEHLRAVRYALRLNDLPRQAVGARIWDSVDCISDLLAQAIRDGHSWLWRSLARLELQATRRYEARAVEWFDRVLLASDRDRRALAAGVAPQPSCDALAVLPNGVDGEEFTYHDPGDRQPQVVFSGAMGYHANAAAAVDLADEIMPRVWAARPDVRLVVVGPSPPRALRRLAARAPRQVQLTGWVPSVTPYLAAAAVAAAPMRYGAGIQNKVLQAMACGAAVVADPGTCIAIGAAADREVLVARTHDEHAAAILALLGDPALRRRLAEAGRRHVEERFSWEAAAQSLEQHYRDVLAAHR